MFRWFSRKHPEPLTFPDNQAAFDYACRHQDCEILLEATIPALVLERGTIDPDGVRHFLLLLAGKDGGRQLWSCTLRGAGDYPEVGDLVSFRVVTLAPELPPEASVIGYIAARLAPVYVEKKGWRCIKSYTPQNLKPTVRW